MASEKFQQIKQFYLHVIVMHKSTKEEHELRLTRVNQRFVERRLTLNDKFQIKMTSIKYMQHPARR